MLFVPAICALCLAVDSVDVAIQTVDGKQIDGSLAIPAVEITTPFGHATVKLDQLASIEFGDVHLVVTADNTNLRGTLDLATLTIDTGDSSASYRIEQLKSLIVIRKASLQAATITDGSARNGVTYHLRAPEPFDANKPYPAIVILHGSNMNSKSYVQTIVSRWPDIAKRYILIGINGEQRNTDAPPDNPTFNYTYVNFVGRSKFKGYPGTDRESPALVSEVLEELKERFKFSKVFLGGHSQGGFLTYSMLMNYPTLVDGVFPISGGVIIQCEPTAYDNPEIRGQQRHVPVAIVHGTTDPAVSFDSSRYAVEVFEDDGFPMLRLFSDDKAGHRFAFLPVDRAIAWLEMMTADDPKSLLDAAEAQIKAGEFRDAWSLMQRATEQDAQGQFAARITELKKQINEAAKPQATQLAQAMADAKSSAWIGGLLGFRHQFGFTDAAKPLIDAYMKIREQHEKFAEQLFNDARDDFQSGNQDAGYAKYQQIVDQYFASSKYQMVKRFLDQRK